jgi:DNA-binding MarR family transcriptional regulator
VSRQAVVLAVMLHRQADMRRWPVVKLPIALLNLCGFTQKAVSRALQQLELKGFVRVHRKPGKRSTVTVLWHPMRELSFVPTENEKDEG